MNNKRAIRLLLLWMSTFLMGGIVLVLIYVQMSVNQVNIVSSVEIEHSTEESDKLTRDPDSEILGPEPQPGAIGTADISEDAEFSHLIEISKPFWKVSPISEPGVSAKYWHTILVQNRFKFDYTITPLSQREWHLVRINNSIRVQFRSELAEKKDILHRKKRGKFSVQMISIEEDKFQLAVSKMSRLLHAGHYAYLYRTNEKFDGKYWYRVRVGFFKNLEDARTEGKLMFEKFKDDELFNENFLPVQPAIQELSRPVIDLRQPLNKPWVIELPLYSELNKAMKDIATLNTEIDFSYISQKLKSASSGKLVFRIRIGFFETKKEAGGMIYKLRKKFPHLKKLRRVRL